MPSSSASAPHSKRSRAFAGGAATRAWILPRRSERRRTPDRTNQQERNRRKDQTPIPDDSVLLPPSAKPHSVGAVMTTPRPPLGSSCTTSFEGSRTGLFVFL